MLIRILITLILVLNVVSFGPIRAYAEDSVSPTITGTDSLHRREKVKEIMAENRALMEQKKHDLLPSMMPLKMASGEMKLQRDEMKKKIEELKDVMEQKREEARNRFQHQREEFKQNLSDIKDQQKKTIVENVDTRINEMNKQHTDNLAQVLSKVSDILGRIEGKVATMEANGADSTEAKKEIANAKTLIQTASDAVTTQASKQYIIDTSNASDEAKLREQVKKTFMTFKSDITAVHEKVQAAREAVVHIARLLGQMHKKDQVSGTPGVTETVSPTVTTTP